MSPVSIVNFSVCLTCAGLNGYPEGRDRYPQICRCHGGKQERWPDHDFNEYLALCWCCGIERIPSGSRFGSFFCPACLELAQDFNRSMGRVVLFVGRHSLMNGIWVRGDEAAEDEEAEGFGEALVGFLKGLTQFREAVDAWRPHRLHQVLRALGWEDSKEEDSPGAEPARVPAGDPEPGRVPRPRQAGGPQGDGRVPARSAGRGG